MKKFLLISMLSLLWVVDAFACSVCFKGDPGQTANVAARAGVLLLLAVIISVLGLFALFFANVAKRSKQFI